MNQVCVVAYHPIVIKGICEIIKEKSPRANVIATATDVKTFISLLKTHKPDSAVIDVSVTWKSKIDIVEEINRIHPHIKLSFISIHPFDHNVQTYLLAKANNRFNRPSKDPFISQSSDLTPNNLSKAASSDYSISKVQREF